MCRVLRHGFPSMHDAIVLSDLHLGAPNCQHQSLSLFLGRILDGTISTKKILLNGDTFDSIDFRRLSPSHWNIFEQIRELSEVLPVCWIYGNHDSPKNPLRPCLEPKCSKSMFCTRGPPITCFARSSIRHFSRTPRKVNRCRRLRLSDAANPRPKPYGGPICQTDQQVVPTMHR